jgi:hypothetical protein
MKLVSLTFGNVEYDTRLDENLEIRLAADPVDRTHIQAVGIPERLYYRLDFEWERGREVFRLPLGVVAYEKIEPDALGIYAVRALSEGENAYLPVHASRAGTVPQSEIVAIVRPGADVSDVRWRQYAQGGSPTGWQHVARAIGLVPKGARLEVVLGRDIPSPTILEVSFLSDGVPRSTILFSCPAKSDHEETVRRSK